MVHSRPPEPEAPPVSRVTTLELFFDLVFVFTLTQLTGLLEHELSLAGAARTSLVFGVLWWMYGGYAWMTNQLPPRRVREQLLLLTGMAGFLVTAVAVPAVFGGTGVAFGLGYLLVICVHLVLGWPRAPRAMARLAPFNIASALLVVAAGFVDSPVKYALWTAAFAIQVVTPYLGTAPQFELQPPHFVERHGLLMIVALGETVIAIGIGVDTAHLTPAVVATVVLALALPAALWWAYFSGDDEAAERALTAAAPTQRALLAIRGYFYAYIPILLGLVVAAVGIHDAVAHPGEPLTLASAVSLAGGVAMFFAGDAEFRRVLTVGPVAPRAALAMAALGTIPVGLVGSAVAQLGALVVLVGFVIFAESTLLVPSADAG